MVNPTMSEIPDMRTFKEFLMYTQEIDASQIIGTQVQGDKSVMPTRWWNQAFLWLASWRNVVVFKVPEGINRYRVGRKLEDGTAFVYEEPFDTRRIAIRRRHEGQTAFAITPDGREIALIEDFRSRDDILPEGVPSI